MKRSTRWEYTIPKPDNLTLETRLENASTFSVSDFRSIEARFRAIGSCKLSHYFSTKEEYERFLEKITRIGSCKLSKEATYAEVASIIYELYKNGEGRKATILLFSFLKPIHSISESTFTLSNRKLLKQKAYRGYVLYVHDFNHVINTLYPELLHQEYPPYVYRQCKEIQSETILRVLYQCFKYIKDSKPLCKAHVKGEPFTEKELYIIRNYKRVLHVLKELFIDPYHCLCKELEERKAHVPRWYDIYRVQERQKI